MAEAGKYAEALLLIMDFVAASRWGVTAREVANETGLNKFRALRMLRALRSAGYVESDSITDTSRGEGGKFIGSRSTDFRWRAAPEKLLEITAPHWDVLIRANADREKK